MMIRTVVGAICLSVVLVAAVPTLSSACRLKECSPTGAATPVLSALHADHGTDTTNKFKGVSNKNLGHYSDGDPLSIEEHPDNVQGNSRERNELRYADRRIELTRWSHEWIELHRTFKSLP